MITQQKGSRFWYAVFRRGKKLQWISLKTEKKSEAKTLHDEIYARFTRERLKAKVALILKEKIELPKPLLVRDVEKRYQEINPNYSPSGMRIWRRFRTWLNKDFQDISDVDHQTALAYLASLSGGGKWWNNVKGGLSRIWNVLKPYTNITVNPWKDVASRPKGDVHFRSFTRKEIKSLLRELKGHRDWLDAVMISLHTGLRKKDVFTLKKDYIKKGAISITPAKTERFKIRVYIPIHPKIKGIIETRCKEADSDGYLFPVSHINYRNGNCEKQFRSAIKRAGIKDNQEGQVGFHSLRSTFATALDIAHVPRHVTRKMLGHTRDLQTDVYSHDRESVKVVKSIEFV